MKIVELKSRRETYGNDARAINRHSLRVYLAGGLKGIEFYLNRTLDGCPPFYCLYFYKPVSALPTMLAVDGCEYWGNGLKWSQAEAKAIVAIQALLGRAVRKEAA